MAVNESDCHVSASAEGLALNRRQLLTGGLASLALWGALPGAALGAGRDPRLLVVVLRGGLDGLSLAAPVGDPAYADLRGAIALARIGSNAGLPLDDLFVLNPSLPFFHGLYQKGEALIVHAVASPYRGRSHFDGQDVLESGLAGVARSDSGWLNRALSVLPRSGAADTRGLGIGAMVPLVMRGPAPVLSWLPKTLDLTLSASTVARLSDLYAQSDPVLAKAFADGMAIEQMEADKPGVQPGGRQRPYRAFIETAEAAARFLSAPDGPRIGALSYEGWDTHANEGAATGQLANRLQGLDLALSTFATGMGAAWAETVVVVVTEFGRTARVNGTSGTDHGTATTALLLGGRVKGRKVLADWPGLGERALFEGRDLAPTMDLRSILKGILVDHVGLDARVLADRVFPGSARIEATKGLLS